MFYLLTCRSTYRVVFLVDISQSFADLHDAASDLRETAVHDAGSQRLSSRGRHDAQADDFQEDFRSEAFRVRRGDDQQSHLAVSHGLCSHILALLLLTDELSGRYINQTNVVCQRFDPGTAGGFQRRGGMVTRI